jgi:MFS family permease
MLRRNTTIYHITQFLHSLVFTIPIWIVYYQGKIEVSQISYLVTIQYVAQMVLELPSGALADMIGRKNTNFIGWVVGALSFLLFPFASTFWHFMVLALMAGLLDSFRSGSEEALLYDTYKQAGKEDGFEKAYGTGNLIYQVGLITATALGGFLYEQWIFLPFVLYGVSLGIGAVLIYFYQEPTLDSETFSLKNYLAQIANGSKEAFKNEYTKFLSLFYIAVSGITWSATLFFNEFMMVELGFSDSTRGVVSAVMRLCNVLVLYLVLQNSKLFTLKRKILFFPIIMIGAFMPGILLQGWWGIPFIQVAMIAPTVDNFSSYDK